MFRHTYLSTVNNYHLYRTSQKAGIISYADTAASKSCNRVIKR